MNPKEIQYPDDMPSGVKEFIQILLNGNPVERMGLSLSSQDVISDDWVEYNHLMKHEFFNDIDIE